MALCKACGSRLGKQDAFCPHCGVKLETKSSSKRVNEAIDTAAKAVEGVFGTNDTSFGYRQEDVEENSGICVLCYLSVFVLVPLFLRSKSRFARFHCNQGLVLLLAELVFGLAVGIAAWVFGLLGLSLIGGILRVAYGVCLLAFVVFGISNAARGKAKELPVIGSLRLLK